MSLLVSLSTHVNSTYFLSGNKLPQEQSCKEVEILGKVKILNIDHNHFKSNVLNNIFNAGQCRKLSDYVIISNDVVIISEMKSNNVSGANKQLINSKIFFDYLWEMLDSNSNLTSNKPVIKFVTFSNKGERPTTKPTDKLRNFIMWNGCQKFYLKCGTTYHISQFI